MRPRPARSIRLAAVALVAAALLHGCGSATISSERDVGASATVKPGIVYVTDFQLDAQNVRSESSPLPPPPPGPLSGILPPPPGAPKAPAVRAREVIELMSTSLVQASVKAGLTGRRPR